MEILLKIQSLWIEIDILQESRSDCKSVKERNRIDKKIDNLLSTIDCLRESCM